MTEEKERLIRIGEWAEANRYGIIMALLAARWGSDELSFLDIEEQKELKEDAEKALNTTIWSRE
jgi:hypothetical protein